MKPRRNHRGSDKDTANEWFYGHCDFAKRDCPCFEVREKRTPKQVEIQVTYCENC